MLTTLAKVKLYAGITGSDQDALITQLIDEVSVYIEGQLGDRAIEEDTYTEEIYDINPKQIEFLLRNYPITDTEPFVAEYRTGSLSAPVWTAYTADDFVIRKGAGFVEFITRFSAYIVDGIRFTYSAGYATVPADLELIANKIIVDELNSGSSSGIKSESLEGHSRTYADLESAKSSEVIAVINKYQRKVYGFPI